MNACYSCFNILLFQFASDYNMAIQDARNNCAYDYYFIELKLDLAFIFFSSVSISLTFLSQGGYIHPDEFFQSVEVTAGRLVQFLNNHYNMILFIYKLIEDITIGFSYYQNYEINLISGDIFGYQVNRPWEFDSRFPIRSIVLPYVTTGPPYLLLQTLSQSKWLGRFFPVTPYTLMLLPRLTFAILSIVCSIYLGRVAHGLGFTKQIVRCTYASSYVALVFFTRTFSNTLEAFLFVLLLYYVRKNLYSKGSAGASVITFIIVAGIFNRPTFIFFALVPFTYWLLSIDVQLRSNRRFRGSILQIIAKLFVCTFIATLIASVFVLCDTMYFKRRTLEQMVDTLITAKSFSAFVHKEFAITPLNFMIYNTDPNNLSEHGLHPRITHMLINIPLLFGPLAFYGLYEFYIYIRRLINGTVLPPRQFLLLSIYVPLILLSVFPHQEPRFLIPLLAPISILYGFQLFGPRSTDLLRSIWLTLTIIGIVFYGFFHQGGVIPAISHLSQRLNGLSPNQTVVPTTNHVIFFHTYMPPHFLFQCHSHSMTTINDLKGSSVETLSLFIKNLQVGECEHKDCSAYLVIPKSLRPLIERVERDTGLLVVFDTTIFPHLSTEDPPNIAELFPISKMTCVTTDEHGNEKVSYPCWVKMYIFNFLDLMQIDIYRILVNTSPQAGLKGSYQS